jgi:UDP-N-acetylglucosamine 2-epimerase (non-hydrolysing)
MFCRNPFINHTTFEENPPVRFRCWGDRLLKICLVFGTRPEIIKLSPIMRYCESKKMDYFMVHTGQHYSYSMDKVFFSELSLTKPKYRLNTSRAGASQIGVMISEIIKIFSKNRPDIVLVQGDTNSVLAGALAASTLGIPVGHVEAGLRSFDRAMPEERNRVLTDHLSSLLFAPTKEASENAAKECIEAKKIFITGNTIVDATYQNLELSRKSNILKKMKLTKKQYILATVHRQENVDNKERFSNILRGFEAIQKRFDMPVICPLHPRSRKMMKRFGIKAQITLTEPLGFLDFLQLENNARLILTDSGGVQEEACILGVPCVTLRNNTERPETIKVGMNMLAGTNPERILRSAEKMINIRAGKKNPFGDGKATEKIMDIVMK